ncbi:MULTISPECIES: MlaE family ABC transporter permease [Bradyrhizobium]|uniref:ABC transporter permease n=1 Tax=Bradyrhizobium symbiodeficiens TaxID=1404367 RepID=A0A2U8QH81_9BRAD|nr:MULTISPECIES: ABC transporter permease [Bradyrhizobium]AWM08628.1 ABC transporter permease [Bradyrhizobium symbiodeficiens]QDF39198.1 ABC transporter permease [Bradyrhizobium symbiodeficiens]QIP01642.1 ABC transporter permease [Bradyrhizobium symbiodeficiens]QIP08723.1 ABC transporter permease [Bradyrhizobium symbiodeficiens]UPJ56508.1 ABC transporter permease [Bradyrhizobium sp. 192]
MNSDPKLERIAKGNALALCATGTWTASFAPVLERMVADAEKLAGGPQSIFIDVSEVAKLDTFGAWLIERLRRSLTQGAVEAQIAGLSANYSSLVDEVRRVRATAVVDSGTVTITGMLEQIGRAVAGVGGTVAGLVDMLGAVLAAGFRVLIHPRSFRLTSTVHHMEQVCWRAVPIVVLITFLIGCIIAQQGIFHFRRFGADIFVVDMLGVLVLREIGVLLVAIMVAGRSGSAYTAELGSMKMREEIDALRTMGFDPIEVLVLPRMMALVLALPILAFLGAMAALYGGGLVAWLYGGVEPEAFLLRLRDAISIDHFIVGIVKAPVMAAVIGIVACVEGLAVQGSAESLGQHTTASVVKGIFFVIVMDGVFAIFFASIGM